MDDFFELEDSLRLALVEQGLEGVSRTLGELSKVVPFGAALFGPDGNLEYVAPTLRQLFGKGVVEFQNDGWWASFLQTIKPPLNFCGKRALMIRNACLTPFLLPIRKERLTSQISLSHLF